MGVYKTAIITTAGQNLIAQALAGNSAVKFTSLKTSNYSYAASTNFETLTSLQGIKQSAGITSAIVVNQTTVKISARVSNVGITTAYYINTIGVYAETDGITETLLAVIPASTADLVPAYSAGAPYSFIYDINLTIQNSSSLNITINDSGVATVADLEHFYEKVYDVYVSDTASGAVASFEDGANKIPMESVNVNMSPVQSFNGYDRPWAPGGGKNKLLLNGQSKTQNGITFTFNNDAGIITINGTATSEVTAFSFWDLPAGDYTYTSGITETYTTIDTYISSGNTTIARGNNNAPGPNFSYSGGRAAITVRVRRDFVANNLVIKPMVRLQTITDDTFEPYANICPISGYDSVTITRAGKNQLQSNPSKLTINGVTFTTNADGTVNTSGTATGTTNRTIYNGYFPAGEYVLTGCPTGGGASSYQIWIYDMTDRVTTGIEDRGSGATGTLVEGHQYDVRIRYAGGYEANQTFYPMIRLASITDATYEPYQSNSYTTNFADAAGTVYGGALDVISGALTITDANIASYAGETLPGEWLSSYDKYAEGATPTTGAQVVYKLATPQTAQIEPLQIDSLYGYNNVWSDVGNIDVKYRADTTLYINKKTAEMQALILENS